MASLELPKASLGPRPSVASSVVSSVSLRRRSEIDIPRPKQTRFLVQKLKQLGSPSNKLLEVHIPSETVRISSVKQGVERQTHTFRFRDFSRHQENDLVAISTSEKDKSRKYLFSTAEAIQRFFALIRAGTNQHLATGVGSHLPPVYYSPGRRVVALPDEEIVADPFHNVYAQRDGSDIENNVALVVTNFRLIFTPNPPADKVRKFTAPLDSISALEAPLLSVISMDINSQGSEVTLFLKDLRVIRFRLGKDESGSGPAARAASLAGGAGRKQSGKAADPPRLRSLLKLRLFPSDLKNIYALRSGARRPAAEAASEDNAADPRGENDALRARAMKDFEAMGVLGNGKFDLSTANHDYKLCSTYSEVLLVPKKASNHLLKAAAKYRSRQRLPVISWARDAQCISRSAQPLPGLFGRDSKEDVELVGYLSGAAAGAGMNAFLIVDARPKINAQANALKGKGFEKNSAYSKSPLLFLDIENIHVMRNSQERVRQLVLDRENHDDWLRRLHESRWMQHVAYVLRGALRVVEGVEDDGLSVLVHCSDGWDRTAQLAALAQIMIEQRYRTIDGFLTVVEKEWLWLGHKCAHRLGNVGAGGRDQSSANKYRNERSPVFSQFLEACFQLLEQFPGAFEFNEGLLLAVHELATNGRFPDFFCNNEKERRDLELYGFASGFDFLRSPRNVDFFSNLYFEPRQGSLRPDCSVRRMRFWDAYWDRWSPDDQDLLKRPQLPGDLPEQVRYVRQAPSSGIGSAAGREGVVAAIVSADAGATETTTTSASSSMASVTSAGRKKPSLVSSAAASALVDEPASPSAVSMSVSAADTAAEAARSSSTSTLPPTTPAADPSEVDELQRYIERLEGERDATTKRMDQLEHDKSVLLEQVNQLCSALEQPAPAAAAAATTEASG